MIGADTERIITMMAYKKPFGDRAVSEFVGDSLCRMLTAIHHEAAISISAT